MFLFIFVFFFFTLLHTSQRHMAFTYKQATVTIVFILKCNILICYFLFTNYIIKQYIKLHKTISKCFFSHCFKHSSTIIQKMFSSWL